MPKVTKNYNPSFNSKKSNNEIVKLAKKGDSITIRIADYPNYYGQHWLETERKYVPCDRVNSDDINSPEDCKYCNLYAQNKVDNADMKPKVSFIFPAIDKLTHKAIFFETSQMVWTEMVNAEQKGIKIFDYDWLIERTENKPKYYEITRLEKEPLEEVDKVAYEEAKSMDTGALVSYRLGKTKKTEQLEEPQTLEDVIAEMPGDNEMPF